MIREASSISEPTLEYDLCIVGGGPAAIAMGREFVATGQRVCMLESGGLAFDPVAQKLADGTRSGLPYFELEEARYRVLGGSAYRWGARSAPLKPIDFTARSWVPDSGWPIHAADLEPAYGRVASLVGLIDGFHYDAQVWTALATEPPVLDPAKLEYAAFQFGKNLLLGALWKGQAKSAVGVDLFLHATVAELHVSGGRVSEVEVRTPGAAGFRVRAQRFVLACGGIENARLLLLSGGAGAPGLCNENDLVGRYFMEHPTVTVGTIESDDPQSLCEVASPGMLSGRLVETGFAISEAVQRRERCLNAYARVRPVMGEDATQALRELLWGLSHRRMSSRPDRRFEQGWLGARLRMIAKNPFGIVGNLYRHARGKPKRFDADALNLEVRTEQAPNPDSRVTLSERTDPLGLRCAHLHWQMNEMDKRTMQVTADTVGAELARLGLGRLVKAAWLDGDATSWGPGMVGGYHHMGTTRMSASPKDGVVDANCKAHSLDNLYIAGSSVFPTAGYVNPTFALLALAIRLADHLKSLPR